MGRKEVQETQELPDPQASLGLGASLASMEALDLREPRDLLANLAWPEPRETKVLKEREVTWVPEVCLAQLEQLDREVPEVLEVPPDPRAQLESLEHQEDVACLVLMVQLVPKDKWETEVRLGPWDLKARSEMWADQDHLDSKDSGAPLAGLDPEEQEVHQARLASLARMERMVSRDLKAFRVCQGPWVHQETKAPWESRAERAILEYLDSKDLGEILARMALLAALDHLVQLVQQEREELLAVLDHGVSRECQDLQARMVHLVKMELLDYKDHQA
jgi:hypothetical protein